LLIAGGDDSANFAQEVVDQRRIWRAAGFADDEIVCYWAAPTKKALAADRAQYEALAEEMRACHSAEPALLRRHLETIARRHRTHAPLPFIYLYVTSHGTRSVLADARESARLEAREAARRATPCERRLVDRPAMVLAGSRPGSLHLPSILSALRAGAELDDLMLTPTGLRDALAELPPELPKIVVLQGCYTGNFIGSGGRPSQLDGLAALPRLRLITAARHDRASFGCQPGTDRTEFGGAYNDVLATTRNLEHPPRVRWRRVYRRTRALIEDREAEVRRLPSQPRFFRSPERRRPSAPPRSPARCPRC
jgi:hypothetical protein